MLASSREDASKVKKLTLAGAVGSIGSMLLGLTQGCGTNETSGGRIIGSDAGDAATVLTDDGGGGGGGVISSRTPFGRSCLKDQDCGGRGIICLTSDSRALQGGGPPNGMCVADCSSDPTICGQIDASSVCVGFSSSPVVAYCLQRCVVGPIPTGDEKCHKRLDTACFQGQTSTGAPGAAFCNPVCRNDKDCGTRKCDLSSGFCMDAKDLPGTLPIGSPCDPALTPDPCRGFCGPLTADPGSPGVCEGLCELGSPGCGTDPNSSAPPAAACLFGPAEADLGDLGSCAQLCDCNDDCKVEGLTCRPFPSAQEATALGRPGYCGDKLDTAGKVAASIACTGGKRDAGGSSAPDGAGTGPLPADGGPDAR
jgi:hypothetical protein